MLSQLIVDVCIEHCDNCKIKCLIKSFIKNLLTWHVHSLCNPLDNFIKNMRLILIKIALCVRQSFRCRNPKAYTSPWYKQGLEPSNTLFRIIIEWIKSALILIWILAFRTKTNMNNFTFLMNYDISCKESVVQNVLIFLLHIFLILNNVKYC